MKNIIFIIAFIIPVVSFSQKLHKLETIDHEPLTLNPTIFDPNMDSSITRIEFLQDTTNNIYEVDKELKYSSIEKSEGFEQIFAIGVIGDFRVSKKLISVVIRSHHTNGDIKEFTYRERIDKLLYYDDFKWSTYGIEGVYYFQKEINNTHPFIKSRCDI